MITGIMPVMGGLSAERRPGFSRVRAPSGPRGIVVTGEC